MAFLRALISVNNSVKKSVYDVVRKVLPIRAQAVDNELPPKMDLGSYVACYFFENRSLSVDIAVEAFKFCYYPDEAPTAFQASYQAVAPYQQIKFGHVLKAEDGLRVVKEETGLSLAQSMSATGGLLSYTKRIKAVLVTDTVNFAPQSHRGLTSRIKKREPAQAEGKNRICGSTESCNNMCSCELIGSVALLAEYRQMFSSNTQRNVPTGTSDSQLAGSWAPVANNNFPESNIGDPNSRQGIV